MPQKVRTQADQSLDELEGVTWGSPSYGSHLVTSAHRLRSLPLKRFRLEDLRLMIGQQIGVEFLVPRALEHLIAHPLASGDFYPGDLLASVMRLPESFWVGHKALIPQAVEAIDGALVRLRKVETPGELAGELKLARARLSELSGGPAAE